MSLALDRGVVVIGTGRRESRLAFRQSKPKLLDSRGVRVALRRQSVAAVFEGAEIEPQRVALLTQIFPILVGRRQLRRDRVEFPAQVTRLRLLDGQHAFEFDDGVLQIGQFVLAAGEDAPEKELCDHENDEQENQDEKQGGQRVDEIPARCRSSARDGRSGWPLSVRCAAREASSFPAPVARAGWSIDR